MSTVNHYFKQMQQWQEQESKIDDVLHDIHQLTNLLPSLSSYAHSKVQILIEDLETKTDSSNIGSDFQNAYKNMIQEMLSDPDVRQKLLIHKAFDKAGFKNNEGGYDDVVIYTLTGVYGEMLSSIEDGENISFTFFARSKKDLPDLSVNNIDSWLEAILI